MNVLSWFVWGALGTIVLTTILAGSQSLGLTRMNIPFLLGTLFTPDRDRAKVIGIGVHLLNGWLFSLAYIAAFHALGRATWVLGALLGLVHALFVLAVALPALPGFHPRMAGEEQDATEARALEPPGFFALHYGARTPVSVVIAHIAFGALLGALYRVG